MESIHWQARARPRRRHGPRRRRHAQATGRLAFSGTGLSFWGGVDPVTGIVIDERHPLCVNESPTHPRDSRRDGKLHGLADRLGARAERHGPGPIVLRDRDAVVAVGALVAREFFDATPPLILSCD